jgi:uncharacterized protein (TIRG00374 family)
MRLVVCGLLLLWIFHAIFLNEGKLLWQRNGAKPDWTELPRADQWRQAWKEGPRELWHTVWVVKPVALALSVVFMGSTILLGVVRWRMVLRVQGLDLPWTRTVEISFVAHFFNSFLLGSTGGDLMKAYYAARETHHKKTEAVTTVFADRLIGLFSMLLFGGLMMFPNLDLLFHTERRLAALAWFTLAMLGACAGLFVLAFWGGVSKGFPSARTWLRKFPQAERIERSMDACRAFGRARAFLGKSFLVSMALNVCCVLQIMSLAWGMGASISTMALFAIVPIIYCISALPITPSGLGVRENLFVWMLGVLSINPTSALSISLLAYAGSLFWSLVGGVVYLSLKESQHLKEVIQE